ncbi:hypothetical protein [Novosphingobium sp. FKTRR1]|uniref:YkvI family membrane protein n=1 Tax=Novosphingobium sp. FKTRR1 TaxID=2879118 RepID=UPI001CF0A6D7|nr:hypothetical protein [Novosphingobium sp. FKTRR1]
MSDLNEQSPSWFQRFILPGFAFKAVVIGGGYATGREMAEFFLPSGAWGGVLGMLLAALVWSAVTALTFVFARQTGAVDYRHFFRGLLGRFWVLYEIAFVLMLVIILAVFGAAAGSLGQLLLGLPTIVGTLVLVAGIAGFTALGNASVEALFKWVSILLYGVYALFLGLALTHFGDRINAAFSDHTVGPEWLLGGLTYAGYNLIGAINILPVTRHMKSDRDAVIAGLLAGPLAMAPAILFFVCMAAWPEVKGVPLPSDFLLNKLNMPLVHWAFQIMIFAALLESGTGTVNAFIERIAGVFHERGQTMSRALRLFVSLVLLMCAVFLADRFGIVQLIAQGYRFLAYAFLAIYVVPLLTLGLWRVTRPHASPGANASPLA